MYSIIEEVRARRWSLSYYIDVFLPHESYCRSLRRSLESNTSHQSRFATPC